MSPDSFHIQPAEEAGPSIQAYEATIIRSQPDVARKVLLKDSAEQLGGLISWSHDGDSIDASEILMDRFDARLLLTSASRNNPGPSASAPILPVANVGWEDLPSDAEDTFFLSALEIENLRIDQRRRAMERNREERMRMIRSQEHGPRTETDAWGGSDEEPDSTQMTLMRRTALQVQASPNSTQLEMRILANYGSDPRFAFLRGRWKRAWDRTKASAVSSMSKSSGSALDALADYGEGHVSSDSEQGDVSLMSKEPIAIGVDTEEKEKMRRRERAREWSSKRRKIQ